MSRRIEINKGDRFGELRILKELDQKIFPSGDKKRMFQCKCHCGEVLSIQLNHLRSGYSKTCGCSRGQKHGLKGHYLYSTWIDIKKRCYNKNHAQYHDYGGRGITMYKPWINNFQMFYDWIMENLGERPEGYTLDRWPNNDGNYSPRNLKWSTPKEQANNRRNSKKNLTVKK